MPEASTVDIADEFSRMIISQRPLPAGTHIIATGDEVLNELVHTVRNNNF